MTDRDRFTEKMLPEIAALPYPKILFSHKPFKEYSFVKYVRRYRKLDEVGLLTDFWGASGLHLYDLEYNFGKQLKKLVKPS